MKKNGWVLVYVLIILIPVMLISISLMELSSIDYKIGNNVICSRQALYNAEAGIIYGLKKLQTNNYNEDTSIYNNEKYMIFDNKPSFYESQNYSETCISYFNNIFTIESKGHYRGFIKTKNVSFNKNSQ